MGNNEVMSKPTNSAWPENVPEGMVLFDGEDIESQEISTKSVSRISHPRYFIGWT